MSGTASGPGIVIRGIFTMDFRARLKGLNAEINCEV
jgi:hypothetical protein